MPKVSVIVPVYGVEKYIGNCIESILSQTFSDFELILVDDGSPDKCGEICDGYAKSDNRVKVLHKQNGGVSSARNYGMKQATGDWLCFVDGDDKIEPTYLEDFNINDTHDLLVQGYIEVSHTGECLKIHRIETSGEKTANILAELEDKNIINSPCFKLYKRSLIESHDIAFDTNLNFGEDHIFSLMYFQFVKSIGLSYSTGYLVNRGMETSLTQRIVPLAEMVYYNRSFLQIENRILNNVSDSNYTLLKSFNKKNLIRLIKTLRDITKRGLIIDELKEFKQFYLIKPSLALYGLSVKEKIAVLTIYCTPYYLLKLLIILYKRRQILKTRLATYHSW